MLGPAHGRACCVGARPLPTVGRAVSVCGPSQGGACCAGVRRAAWSSVLLCCVASVMVWRAVPVRGPIMVGRAVLVPVCRGGRASCGGAWLGLLSCVPPGGRRWAPGGGAFGGVLAGAMRGLFCLFRVVFPALRSACSGGCGRRLGCGFGCVDRLARVGSVLVRGPPHRWACCVGACPPPWGGVLPWFVVPRLGGACCVGPCPPHGGACCVGSCPTLVVGRAVLVRGPPRGWACRVGASPPR